MPLPTRAFQAKDFRLAFDRYMFAIHFIEQSMEQNVYMLQVKGGNQEKLDTHSFLAELGLTQSCIGHGDWEEAAFHIKLIIRDIPERQHVSKEMIKSAKGLGKRIKKKLGASYDKATLGKESTADEAKACMNLKDGKADASGKKDSNGGKRA